jgi:hypothetical protein
MFCPKCKSEYRQGYTHCADCDVDLVPALDSETLKQAPIGKPEYVDFRPVLTTFNHGDIAFIKSLLDSEDINYYFQGENFHMSRFGVQPAVLMVHEKQVSEAEELLKDVELNYLLLPTEPDKDDDR